MSTVNILMTGAGAPGAAGILKCLKQEGRFHIIAADARPNPAGKYLADDFVTIPLAGDNGFAEAIAAICKRKDIRVVMPLVTKELIPLAQYKPQLEKLGVKVLVAPASSLEIANNKSRLYEFLQWRGLAVPEFRVVETAEQFKQAAKELGFPGKAICFKPSVSNGSRGFRIIDDKADEYDLLFNHKPSAVYMRYEEAVRVLSAAPFPELLVSEFLPGEEYSVDCLACHGEAVVVAPRVRTKTINGITTEGVFIQQPDIIAYCTRIIKELQLHGNTGIQVKKSEGGAYLLLEINPRVQGTISAGLGAGINLPVLAIKQELGWPISPEEMRVQWGTRFIRYWEEVFY